MGYLDDEDNDKLELEIEKKEKYVIVSIRGELDLNNVVSFKSLDKLGWHLFSKSVEEVLFGIEVFATGAIQTFIPFEVDIIRIESLPKGVNSYAVAIFSSADEAVG